ncbi:hypothetical protein HNP38_002519 [Chryseobacterium defluvii]|uniref:Erythromycin esterase n=1 Tax=Chryseobacterium defluvii TaxID=160396 RepID=A0A840KF66_9FLAO|nr:hypothetical protein [Chryseobacterium defluvii]MBB4807215.1 hypothetical protein [Chryseobacterium defluvii]
MKRIIKILKYLLGFIVASAGITVMYFYISNRIFLGSVDSSCTEYLKKNKLEVDGEISGDFFNRTFFDSDVFLFGEVHGFATNQELDGDLLLFLHKKAGLKNYLAEMDSTSAWKLNRFLHQKSKDTLLLKEFIRDIEISIPQQAGKELYTKWSRIYDYNKTLPDSRKIVVWGIDRTPGKNTAVSRDSAMMINFNKIVRDNRLSGEKFYGQFGLFHVLQSTPVGKDAPLAKRLKDSGLKVTSFVSYTLNSEMYMPKGHGIPVPENEKIAVMNADGPFMMVKGIMDLKEASGAAKKTLFNLDNAGSPYDHSLRLLQIKNLFGDHINPGKNKTSVTTQYFQYVFLVKNSNAITPIR